MGKKRTERDMQEEVQEEEIVQEQEDPMMDEDEEEEEEEEAQIHEGDEMQEVLFDVDVMEGCDQDGVFHILQRWVPPLWCLDMDEVVGRLGKSELTSIIKIPDQNQDPEVNLGDDKNDIYGVVGIVDLATQPQLVQKLSITATTEEVSKQDLSELISPAALKTSPVGLIVSERLVNLPAELGSQLHVNLFEELAENPELSGKFEYYMLLARIRMRADEELDELDRQKQKLEEEAGMVPKNAAKQQKKKKVKPAAGAEELLVTEQTCLFTRPEEIFYFRNRHMPTAVKRFILDPEISSDVVTVPIIIHKSQIPKTIEGIKTLDSYFLEG
eukprot:TRINITY_DN2135_c0_g1_i1.p1 TRINITY_DN2135_c0_g1~~TRINITY_DN2135_c0_g1_i1.p1  ORF type:complete len:328 (+),score=86.49 TRINITY_DN2135_c0_g1_i1:61-1044(+)